MSRMKITTKKGIKSQLRICIVKMKKLGQRPEGGG